jgi:hypothetical protein
MDGAGALAGSRPPLDTRHEGPPVGDDALYGAKPLRRG